MMEVLIVAGGVYVLLEKGLHSDAGNAHSVGGGVDGHGVCVC